MRIWEIVSFLEMPESIPDFSADSLKRSRFSNVVVKKDSTKRYSGESPIGTAKFSIDIPPYPNGLWSP